jgi:hypothetical protein
MEGGGGSSKGSTLSPCRVTMARAKAAKDKYKQSFPQNANAAKPLYRLPAYCSLRCCLPPFSPPLTAKVAARRRNTRALEGVPRHRRSSRISEAQHPKPHRAGLCQQRPLRGRHASPGSPKPTLCIVSPGPAATSSRARRDQSTSTPRWGGRRGPPLPKCSQSSCAEFWGGRR